MHRTSLFECCPLVVAMLCFVVTNFLFAVPTSAASAQTMQVSYINVGQGDSELIQTPNGSNVLIDAGPTSSGAAVVSYLRSRKVTTLAAVICTYPDEDNIGGMPAVFRAFAVKSIYMPKVQTTAKTLKTLLAAIKNEGIAAMAVKAGVKINVDKTITIQFLGPTKGGRSNLNDYSAVLKVTDGKISFLFVGDASTNVERDLSGNSALLGAMVGGHWRRLGKTHAVGTVFR